MKIEEIVKKAFDKGWDASQDCITIADYQDAIRKAILEISGEVKKLNEPVVMQMLPTDEEIYGAMRCVTAYYDDEVTAIKVCDEMNRWWKFRLSVYENKTKV